MLDHVSLYCHDLGKTKTFYEKALAPLGYALVYEFPGDVTGISNTLGFGIKPKASFWISEDKTAQIGRMHMAFNAPRRAMVDAFYAATIAAGGRDNGRPGLRPHYHPDYYGAFVVDPNGYNVEAVYRGPA